MSRYDQDGFFPPYIPVAERRARADQAVKALRKKNPAIHPVVVSGRKLAETWWGEAWNRNLGRYADFANRIGRGRSYVRHGAVLDLSIQAGSVNALVQGSRAKPYQVVVDIDPMDDQSWESLTQACQGLIPSLPDLIDGRFPKALATLFQEQGGLFPTPAEIHLECSCPDWASLCKHVSAVLYGVGTRLDENPLLFFQLRQVAVDDLISQAVQEKTETLLQKARQKSERVLDTNTEDLNTLFGIDLKDEPD